MNDLPAELVKALTPFASDMYHQGYADALEAAVRIVELVKTPELVAEVLRESIPEIRHKTTRRPKNINEKASNSPTIASEPTANPSRLISPTDEDKRT